MGILSPQPFNLLLRFPFLVSYQIYGGLLESYKGSLFVKGTAFMHSLTSQWTG